MLFTATIAISSLSQMRSLNVPLLPHALLLHSCFDELDAGLLIEYKYLIFKIIWTIMINIF